MSGIGWFKICDLDVYSSYVRSPINLYEYVLIKGSSVGHIQR